MSRTIHTAERTMLMSCEEFAEQFASLLLRVRLLTPCLWDDKCTQNETQCQECEREIICLAYFYHEAEQIGIEVHCAGRTIPLGIPKQLPPFESKLGLDENRVTGITNIQNNMINILLAHG